METGLAFGASALVFVHYHATEGKSGKHYAIDPNQLTRYRGAALGAVKDAGLDNHFEWRNGPSHLQIPKLIEAKLSLDCAFIDGWHTFDYTLVDFFLIDKLLKVGGLVAFHDMYGPAKQKVLRFVLSHRDYEIATEHRVRGGETAIKTLKFFSWRTLRSPSLLFSGYHWRFQLQNSSGLLVLQKRSQFEPDFDYYKDF